ncbi:hypothetical protein [Alcanivorax profundi]|uniref:hypothetical protein n=1 Tax=Alcanivorax profundi TaxID=2338368 RepID=UPI0011C3C4DD|nr:hypothetical protein [Alcanivorax profundi]
MLVLVGLCTSNSSFRALGRSSSSILYLSSLSSTKDLNARVTAGPLSPAKRRFSWAMDKHYISLYEEGFWTLHLLQKKKQHLFFSLPERVLQIAELGSGPTQQVQPDPIT